MRACESEGSDIEIVEDWGLRLTRESRGNERGSGASWAGLVEDYMEGMGMRFGVGGGAHEGEWAGRTTNHVGGKSSLPLTW